ncbi:MAG: fatty acid desaturase [Ilumatobacteraceae bacterium]
MTAKLGGMVPSPLALGHPRASEKIRDDGRPTPQWRTELRRITGLRNSVTVVLLYAQTIGIVWLAVALHNPFIYVVAFVLMGRTHAQFASLMHESAHRLLFANKSINDFVGRWLLGYPSFVNTDAYRFVHMAHHREEFGPNEPDIALYANYPITQQSFRRKLMRDSLGITGIRLMRAQFAALFHGDSRSRNTQLKILAVQACILAVLVAIGHPFIYFFLWLLPFLTVWRVINRLRAIAEHGGLRADTDRRITTHSVRQATVARFMLVPYNIGWHLAHHVDAGIPFRSLPAYHKELRRIGYVTAEYEYPSYRALWRALRAG